ncbi:hypothetical protein [Acetobacter senegalensis]|uniref:hypothetical protein n=1 Tax=Acetobacter senegalensis TaxID=446692 RepID=UPI0026540390|nr:hypothetical protein [Acetobacter senegalensis]MDN7351153.1 hypothetical protein [Acetobacter senegalensis]
MIALCVFLAWASAFWAHESLQPRTSKLLPLTTVSKRLYQCVRACAPALALLLCLYRDFEEGILYWLGLGAVAGLAVSLLMAALKHKQSGRL